MLKKLVFLVVIVVFIGPVYDFSKFLFHKFSTEQPLEQILTAGENILTEQAVQVVQEVQSLGVNGQKVEGSQEKYTALSTKQLEDCFYTAFTNWQTDFVIVYKGDTANIEQLIETATTKALARDEYVSGHIGERSIQFEYSRISATIHVQQSYLMTPTQAAYVNQQVSSIVSAWQGLSDFEKIRAVNDYIVKHTTYTLQSKASPYSAYTVLAEGKGVCQGYALLALKMLQELGVTTKYIVGYVGSEGHAWNLVKLDGQWYHLDPTWNDPTPNRPQAVSYEYFLVDDATLARDHSWIKADYPAASSKRFAALHHADFANVYNGMLYFSHLKDDNTLYRMDLKTLQDAKLTDSRALYLAVYGDWIYFSNYSNGAYLSKIRTNGSEEQVVYKGESADLYIDNGYLYFTANGQKRIVLQ